MITRMTKYSFVLLSGDKDTFLEKLQGLGVVDITRSSKPVDDHSRDLLAEMEDIQEEISCIKKGTDTHLVELESSLAELRRAEAEVRPWGEYDAEALAALNIPIRYYRCTEKKFDAEWPSQWAIQEVTRDGGNVWFVLLGDSEGFPLKDIPAPQHSLTKLNGQIADAEAAVSHYKEVLEGRKSELPDLQRQLDSASANLSKYLADASGQSSAEDALVIFEGFAPTEKDAALKADLEELPVLYLDSPATADDNPPVKLRNNWFTKQFEVLTEMYGMPVYNEFDPTVFLSIFFLLFFAMCMGDAGYGLLLIAIGFALKGKEGGLAKLWSLIITLGAGTVVVGLVMGGFFGIDLSTKEWVPEGMRRLMITGDWTVGGSTYSKQMILSLGIGILHICLAMIIKAVWAVRNNGFKNSLGTLGWTLLIVGCVLAFSVGLLGIVSESAMEWLLIGIAGVSALGIFIFNKWGRNPLVNIGSGLWDTYSMASGLMGDVLSYLRLYALGMSGSMLGATFNQIAGMVLGTDPTWQWLPFVLIVLFGHALNLALSCLGAFVHPLRLNFVEFFKNSDYQGRGVSYNPLKK